MTDTAIRYVVNTSQPFDPSSPYALVRYTGRHAGQYGIRHSASGLIARFGIDSRDMVVNAFARFREGTRPLYFTEDGEHELDTLLYTGVDWSPDPADEGEPHRAAQAQALAAMRRREAEAVSRAETAERARAAAQSSYSQLRERVAALNTALNEQAEEREWCSEFEEFVEEFPDLLSVETKTVTVTLELELSRTDETDAYSVAAKLYEFSTSQLVDVIQSVD